MPTKIPRNYHSGEVLAQQLRGFEDAAFGAYENYQAGLSATDPYFFPSLNILPLTTLDEEKRPWVSVLTSKTGLRGFIRFGKGLEGEDILRIRSNSYDGLPLRPVLESFQKKAETEADAQEVEMVASVGVEFSNRRRNKFEAGLIRVGFVDEEETEFDLEVFNSFGNCPKYINIRHLVPPATLKNPTIVSSSLRMAKGSPLPVAALEIVDSADLVYLGTRHTASQELGWGQEDHDRLGCNHRGGAPGFVRSFWDEEKARTCLVLPDFSGNRLMMSFGNISGKDDQVAGLTIPRFGYHEDESTSTSILHLTGDAQVVVDKQAEKYIRGIKSCLLVWITGYSIVKNVPLVVGRLEGQEAKVGWSPYNPVVKKLINEKLVEGSREAILASAPKAEATLVRAHFHSEELGVFTFRAPLQLPNGEKLTCQAGQHVVLDASSALEFRVTAYRHMAGKGQEKELNDDGVRSWTITSHREVEEEFEFSLTLRKVQQGAVTPTIFWQGHRLVEADQGKNSPNLTSKNYVLPENPLKFPLMGIAGEMNLKSTSEPLKLLYMTSGIGITPFLAHLHEIMTIQNSPNISHQSVDIAAVLACRKGESQILQKLIQDALTTPTPKTPATFGAIKIHVQILTRGDNDVQLTTSSGLTSNISLKFDVMNNVRLFEDYFSEGHEGSSFVSIQDREVYICGTVPFEKAAREALSKAEVQSCRIHHESFSF